MCVCVCVYMYVTVCRLKKQYYASTWFLFYIFCKFMCVCIHIATHRHHSEDHVDDPDSYSGINWMTDTSSREDSGRVVKDLKEKTSKGFLDTLSGCILRKSHRSVVN